LLNQQQFSQPKTVFLPVLIQLACFNPKMIEKLQFNGPNISNAKRMCQGQELPLNGY